jgi:hypothetical protein
MSRAKLILISAFLMAAAACSPRLSIENDTFEPVKLDVIGKSRPRPASLRTLQPGGALDAKMCGTDALTIYIQRTNQATIRGISAKDLCPSPDCGCTVKLSRVPR